MALLDMNEYGLVSPVPPVNVTDKFALVVLDNVQKAPLSLDDKDGTVRALNPELVMRYSVEMVLDDSANDSPEILDVIQRYSVGAVRRTLEDADKTRLKLASLVTEPTSVDERVTSYSLALDTANPPTLTFVIAW
jgi:hypothetical protein